MYSSSFLNIILRYLFIGSAIALDHKINRNNAGFLFKFLNNKQHGVPGAGGCHVLPGGITCTVHKFCMHMFNLLNNLDVPQLCMIRIFLSNRFDFFKN